MKLVHLVEAMGSGQSNMPPQIAELRKTKVDEIKGLLEEHYKRTDCKHDFLSDECGGVSLEMFLYDLLNHEPDQDELNALSGGHVPAFLQPGVGGRSA